MKYSLNPDVVLVTVLGESMFVVVDKSGALVSSMRTVSEAGVYYWRLLETGMDTEEIIAQAVRERGDSEESARKRFTDYLFELRDIGYLTLED